MIVSAMLVRVGTLLGFGWRNVGSWLAEYCFMVGGLMLGQRLSNEQTYVGPTKIYCCWANIKPTAGFWLATV